MSVLWITLAVIALQRAATIAYSQRNSRRLLERGGVEVGAIQYPLIALLQAAWLIGMVVFVPASTPPNWWLLGACFFIEVLHVWAIVTLGPNWSTRIITVPGSTLVRRGPYRFLRHPNYLAVLLEIALLPLAFGAYAIAAVFTVLYAVLILWRIHVEDRLLYTAS